MSRVGDSLYRVILRAFPPEFRHRHGDGMEEQFRTQRRAVQGQPLSFVALWTRAVVDGLRHGLALRLERRGGLRPQSASLSRWIGDWTGDLRKAARALWRQPAFTLTAIATLTLGIGANAAVFALAWHTSFRPLPYPNPGQLIRIFESNPAAGQPMSQASPASTVAWADRAQTLEVVAGFGRSRVVFPLDDSGAVARYQSLSPGVFAALGVRPILGRVVLTDADRQPDEVVISYEYWQRRFGGDPGVIDRLHHFADVADEPERIIGVMPPGFQFLEPADIWAINLSVSRGRIGRSYRAYRGDAVMARVRAGHIVAEATAEIARISADLAREFPDTHAGWTPVVRTLHDTVVGKFSIMAWLLIAAAGAVFLVACTNVAGLLVMRAAGRSHEVRLRLALGASRWRIVRLWLLEGVVVASVSLAAGLISARWLVDALAAIAPDSLPRLDQVAVSAPTIAVGALGAMGFVLVYALAPVVAGVTGGGPVSTAPRTVSSSGRGRGILLATQACLASVLLTGTVLFATSLQHLYDEPLGFDPRGVLSVRLSPHYAGNRRPWALAADFGRALEERVQQYPGVLDAAVSTMVPLTDGAEDSFYRVDGDPAEQRWGAIEQAASPGYLTTLGLTLKTGRWFTAEDRFTAERLIKSDGSDHLAVITESMARALWPNESALGKRLVSVLGDPSGKLIVGVIGDLKFQGAGAPPTFRVFVPWYQRPGGGSIAVLVKTAGDPRDLAAAVEAIARGLRPGTGVHAARTLEDLYRASSADTSFAATLVGGFSFLALMLTGVGVFGAVGYSIATRRRELAIRLALGAGRARISATAAASGFLPVLAGTLLGLVVALSCVRFIRGLLFEVNPLSPAHYAAAGAMLLVVAAVASAAPLRRLLAIDPAESLRAEAE